MKDTNKVIIILILLIIVLISMIFIIAYLSKQRNEQQIIEYGEKFEIPEEEQRKKDGFVYDISELKLLENCIQNYYDILNINSARYYSKNQMGEYAKNITDEEINDIIISLLSKNFINSNSIKSKNLNNYIKTVQEKEMVTIVKANATYGKASSKYVVYGFITNTNYEFKNDFYMYINLDMNNQTFSLEPIYNKTIFEEIKLDNIDTVITKNENNTYKNVNLNIEEKMQEYINKYKKISLGNPEIMYKYFLDEEYKNKKFEDYKEYEQYIEKKKNIIKSIRVEKYDIVRTNDYNKYIIIDQKGKYYIFKEYNNSDCKVILDTYTIDLPEFIEKYSTSLNIDKVKYNIQKVFDSLNDGDYKYVYNRLNETFRNNNYNTLLKFETYMKDNLFEYNKVKDATYEENGNNYVFDIKVTDEKEEKNKNVKIIMKLEEGTNFTMSFSID